MSIRPIAATRLHQRIADEITRLMDDGTFNAGERLPAERELARLLDVSRSSLREALGALEMQGRIAIKIGSGAYVMAARRPRKTARTRGGKPESSPFDVLRARRIIESEAAAMAARNATAADLRAMDRAFTRLAADMRANRVRSPADREFHELIAAASGNGAIADIVKRLWDEGWQPLGVRIEELFVTRGRKRDNIGEHQAILEAIRGHDSAAARRAMRTHIGNALRQRMG